MSLNIVNNCGKTEFSKTLFTLKIEFGVIFIGQS